jgi:hypothetical protein
MMLIYIASGCDYVSFFSKIGKPTVLKIFYQYANFICGNKQHTPGTLADTDVDYGFLSFLRLIGTIYFKKHNTGFETSSPLTYFHSFHTATIRQHHLDWLNGIRQTIWLFLHWKRSCWVSDLWRQADKNEIIIKSISEFGWTITDGKVAITWDTEENVKVIRKRAEILLKGCKCKKGCKNDRCKCRKENNSCTEGCECVNCENVAALPVIMSDSEDTSDSDDAYEEYCMDVMDTDIDNETDIANAEFLF